MKKLFILLAAVLTGLMAQAQTDVTMVDNIGDYTGSDAYVYNKADGKVYVKNNLGDYERYGVYPKVATLKVAGGGDTDIEYIATTDNMSNMPYINTGYTHKADTRVVVECDLSTKSNTWQAVYGARANVTSQGFIFFCRFDGNNQGCYVRDWQEKRGDADLPRGEKITIDAQGKFCYVYDKDGTLVSTIETDAVDGTSEGNCPMYIFDLNNNGDRHGRDNSSAFMKLYSFKVYEGETLVMDLQPIVSATGKGGLRDKVSGQRFFSAQEGAEFALSPDGVAAASEAGITVYDGKMVVNTTDGKVYKYVAADEAFTEVGPCAYEPLADESYKNLNNWETNGDHAAIYDGKIEYDAEASTNYIASYVGTGGHEPLMIRVATEPGEDYNFAFNYSCSPYWSWHGVEMHAYVCNFYDLWTSNSGQSAGGDILATYMLPFDGADDVDVSLDFTAQQDTETLLYQFGDVEDGDRGFWFRFNRLLVQKYVYPEAYPVVNPFKELLSKVIELAKADGVDTEEAEQLLASGTDGFEGMINTLRVARKVANMDTDDVDFKGNAPAEGKFYLYNVGRKAYLTSGSDWGTHAALGYPGLECTLTAEGDGYTIRFDELIQGDARDRYLGGSPYVDCSFDGRNVYVFTPVEGKENVYTVKGDRGYMAFDSNGEVDGGGSKHFNTVTAMWAEPNGEDAQWMLVTKDDRLALMDTATPEQPADVTVLVRDASFNKFAALDAPWTDLNQGWEWGNRHFGDKNTETYNSQEYNLSQTVTLPRAGVYEVSVQAYYRDGNFEAHVESVANGDELHAPAVLYAGVEETPLAYIHAEADKAPGEGRDSKIGNMPDNMMQAAAFFQTGCYRNTVRLTVDEDNKPVAIGIRKTGNDHRDANWIVADNFRVKYLGSDETVGIREVAQPADAQAAPVYNLRGQRVLTPAKGLYISGGRKVLVK